MDINQHRLRKYLDLINSREIIRLGLDSWRHLLAKLPESRPLVITVAGTNGKGSFVEVMSKAFALAGISCAAYTSPHLFDFKERLLVDRQMLTDADWLEAFTWLEGCADVELTPFEFYTLSALYLAHRARVEVLILEVGLGGRFDAVNVIEPDYSIITEIDFDHTERLGNSLAEIAYQKAGIMRAGKPAIFAGLNARAELVRYAKEEAAEFYLRGRDFDFCNGLVVPLGVKLNPGVGLATPSALAAVFLATLLPFDIHESVVHSINSFALAGRFEQVLFGGYRLIFDVAHNPASFKNLMVNVRRLKASRVGMWLSFSRTKDVKECIACLQDDVAMACVSKYSEELAHDCDLVSSFLQDAGIEVVNKHCAYDKPLECFEKLSELACDCIIVAGSFYHVSMVKKQLELSNIGVASE